MHCLLHCLNSISFLFYAIFSSTGAMVSRYSSNSSNFADEIPSSYINIKIALHGFHHKRLCVCNAQQLNLSLFHIHYSFFVNTIISVITVISRSPLNVKFWIRTLFSRSFYTVFLIFFCSFLFFYQNFHLTFPPKNTYFMEINSKLHFYGKSVFVTVPLIKLKVFSIISIKSRKKETQSPVYT